MGAVEGKHDKFTHT